MSARKSVKPAARRQLRFDTARRTQVHVALREELARPPVGLAAQVHTAARELRLTTLLVCARELGRGPRIDAQILRRWVTASKSSTAMKIVKIRNA